MGTIAPAQPPSGEPTAAFERGQTQAKDGKFEGAIKEFDDAIRLRPAFAEAFDARGQAYESLHQQERAYSDYDQAVALQPDFVEALSHRGKANNDLGRPKNALEDFDRVIKLKPDFEVAFVGRGYAYSALRQYDRAMEDFTLAIKLKPNDPEAFEFRALAQHGLGKDGGAFDDFARAMNLKPDFGEALNDRGVLYDDLGRHERAITDYDAAIKLKPDLAVAFYNRGNSYKSLGKYSDAIANYDQVIKLRPGYASAFNNRAIAYRNLRQFSRAIADYSEAIRLRPDYALALENRGTLYKLLRQPDLAIADFNRARDAYDTGVRADPNSRELLLARARTAYDAERWKDAIADYSAIIALNDSAHFDDAFLANLYLQRGQAHDAGGDNEAGLADVESALRLNRRIDQGQFRRASLRRALGKYEEALDDYNEMSRDDDPIVYFNRAVTYFCLGRFREAENDVRLYLKLYKDEISSFAWIHIFRVKRSMADDERYAELKSPFPATDWITQIADLYRGRQTIEKTEQAMTGSRQDPRQKDNWPCSTLFYLGEYKLEHGDLAGAKADLEAISPVNCNYAEADAAVAELKRLPEKIRPPP